MHASTIQDHEALTRAAAELATAWEGTDPMHDRDEVRRALVATNPRHREDLDGPAVDELLPYLCDALRARGLLVTRSASYELSDADRAAAMVLDPEDIDARMDLALGIAIRDAEPDTAVHELAERVEAAIAAAQLGERNGAEL